jgi:hypothetical protein
MAANVKTAPSLIVGAPQALFALPKHSQYEVAPDGRRFLVNSLVSWRSPLVCGLELDDRPKGQMIRSSSYDRSPGLQICTTARELCDFETLSNRVLYR